MDQAAQMLRLLKEAGLDAPCLERIAAYGALLLEANRRFNLTGAKSPDELLPHLIDSLSIGPYVRGRYVDVGSGGGLPAIPVALATGVEPTLVEAVTKKAVFLRSALHELGLPGQVLCDRAEAAGRDPVLRESFDSATARAVSSAPTVAELLLPLLRMGGVAVVQRGAMETREREALADAAPMLGGRLVEEHRLDGERRILIIRKEGPTPDRFPRRAGIPEKRPLCQ